MKLSSSGSSARPPLRFAAAADALGFPVAFPAALAGGLPLLTALRVVAFPPAISFRLFASFKNQIRLRMASSIKLAALVTN